MYQKNIIIIIILFLLCSCFKNSNTQEVTEKINYYTQETNNRTAAEWEPAIGTLVVWPLSIPYKLAIELAKDNHLFTMVENEAEKAEAEKWYIEWGIDLNNVTFIFAEQGIDAWWTRDWGPSAVFDPDGDYQLADGKYIYATPVTDMECNDRLRFLYHDENNEVLLTKTDDDATIPLAKQLNYDLLDLPFNNTGGNVLTDGLGTAFSTCVLLSENKYYGVNEDQFFKLNDSLLGFKNYNIISNFEENGIQHIDCLLKLIDEETILVAKPPKDHKLYDVYESIVKDELSILRTPYGKPYRILRIETDTYRRNRLAAYTNSLILNKTVYVPLFDIPKDDHALKTWAKAMPGYEIKGFTFHLKDEPIVSRKLKRHYFDYGWNDGDALHCRTRAIWDPEMLFISVNTINPKVKASEKNRIQTTIIDYSEKGLIKDKCTLFWKATNETNWNQIVLTKDNDTHFFAEIPEQKSGTSIEYYIVASSKSGAQETRPVTAPVSTYKFTTQ